MTLDKLTKNLLNGKFQESISIASTHIEEPSDETLNESEKTKGGEIPKALMVTVEGIHAGMTKNNTYYPADKLEQSAHTWTDPYSRPVIKNHDTWEEPTGRVKSATFKDSVLKPNTKTIQLELHITDPNTIEKVLDGRYQTLSIGGSTNEARCSICATNVVEAGWCGHSKGKTYDGKEAYWIIGSMEFNEISWVNVPADVNARVVDIKPVESSTGGRKESVEVKQPGAVQESNETDLIDGILGEGADETEKPAVTEGEETPPTPEGEKPAQTQTEAEGEKTDAEKLTEALARIGELEKDVQTVTEERDNLKTEKQTIETTVTEKETEITLLKEERDNFRNKSITLAKTAHKFLAESAVNLRIALGEATLEEKEGLLGDYAKTPAKVLESTINDLLHKPAASKQTREQATPAVNPGAVNTEGAHSVDAEGDITESTTANEQPVAVDIEELAKRMIDVITANGRF